MCSGWLLNFTTDRRLAGLFALTLICFSRFTTETVENTTESVGSSSIASTLILLRLFTTVHFEFSTDFRREREEGGDIKLLVYE
jgi:hypothetical protein